MRIARLLSVVLFLAVTAVSAGGEIQGTIYLSDGESLSGPIRWDKNENYWDDVLDAAKVESTSTDKEQDRGFQLSFFGFKIADVGGHATTRYFGFSIPFGHLAEIAPIADDRVLLTLKNGDEFEVVPLSTDLGRQMRGLEVEDPVKGRIDVKWWMIKRIVFAPGEGKGRDAARLYGTVESAAGSFSGFITWDRDEAMGEDVLDGEDPDGNDHEIRFEEIKTIERLSRGGSRVVLVDGTELVLDGTNDVDDGHRGIMVSVSGVGTVDIEWDDFEKLTLVTAPASPGYDGFDGGRRLEGVVSTHESRKLRGHIVWDQDESYSWERLDGDHAGVDYSIPFVNIASIRELDDDSCEVELTNGDVFRLSGSNDVNRENRGVLVIGEDGLPVELTWDQIDRVDFD